jgi:multidrug resistance efflux pump
MESHTKLRSALASVRGELEEGLAEAEAELAQLDERREELTALIAQARAALGMDAPVPTAVPAPADRLTLHEALATVLREHGNAWMRARELADEVNSRGLYRKRDGSPVEVNQVHARVKNYAQVFEKDGSRIKLRDG